jgi:hypothetical protein
MQTALIYATTLTGKGRKQTILLRSRRRWPAPQEVQNQWQRGLCVDGAEHVGLCLPACANPAVGDLTGTRALSPCTVEECAPLSQTESQVLELHVW